MKKIVLVVLALAMLTLTGCGAFFASPVVPPQGMIYSNYTATQDVDLSNTTLGSKRGEASVTSYLGWISEGDCGVYAAAKNGGITKITHTDYQFKTILGIVSTYTTIVYGE